MRLALALIAGLLLVNTAPASAQSAETCIQQAQTKAGKINHTWQAHCLNKVQRPALLARIGHPDLVNYLQAQNVAIAENIDRGRISPNEGAAMTQQATANVISEAQRRNRAQAPAVVQQQPRTMTFCNTLGFSTVCY